MSDVKQLLDAMGGHAASGQTARERRRAKICGDRILVVCIRPAGEPGWLYVEHLSDIEDYLLDVEQGDEWEIKWILMTRAELDALPEHPGW